MKHPRVWRPALLAILLATVMPATAFADPPCADNQTGSELATIEGTIRAVYDVISGPAGQARDAERFRSFFAPGARLIPVRRDAQGKVEARALTPEEYIEQSFPFLLENGFYEKGVASRVEVYGCIAHVWSTYEARRAAEDPKPFMRGINSFQLLNDGERWWVVTIYWQRETPDLPLPAKYQ